MPREVAKAQWKQHRKAVATRVKQERHVAQNSTWTRRTHAAAPGAPLPPLPPPLPASATGANSIAVAVPGALRGTGAATVPACAWRFSQLVGSCFFLQCIHAKPDALSPTVWQVLQPLSLPLA